MDHNLGDPLNLESAMGVDFEHSEDVVSHADIQLESSGHEESIPMEFDHIEEQPILMDTGNEEIIDFMGGQFTLQEFSVDGDQMPVSEVTVEASDSQNIENSLISHSDTMIDLQFDQSPITIPAATADVLSNFGPRIISVGSVTPETIVVSQTGASAPSNKPVRLAPRQVAIAPKPSRPAVTKVLPKFVPGKQFAIAPKPKQVSLVKKVSLSTAMQAKAQGNTVIAQIGKQFVMLPSGEATKKIKLVPAGSGGPTVRLIQTGDSEQAQLIPNQNASSANHTKVIIQGQPSGEPSQPSAVITKLLSGGPQPGARFVTVHQKVPISIVNNNKMVVQSPVKSTARLAAAPPAPAAPPARLLPAPSKQPTSQGTPTTTKKIVITSNSGQNVVLKSAVQKKTTPVMKTVTAAQKTMLHPINVPGKGIQYIRLVTNPTTASAAVVKTSPKPGLNAKTFVLTDGKGGLMKMLGGQPPPLLVTGKSNSNKSAAKPPQRLVRIAPLTSKSQVVMRKKPVRAGQSLLAPISAPSEPSGDDVTQPLADGRQQELEEQEQSQCDDVTTPHFLSTQQSQCDDVTTQQIDCHEETATFHVMKTEVLQNEDVEEAVETETLVEYPEEDGEEEVVTSHVEEREVDSKAALQALIADTVSSPAEPSGNYSDFHSSVHSETTFEDAARPPPEIHVSFERCQSPSREGDHPLIVIPSCLRGDPPDPADDEETESHRLVNVEVDPYSTYQSSSPPPDTAGLNEELGLRPRKPCNCTKSQCLKLYCDCFANGEFCNQCNCNNCLNNLENEELRQKAIKGCLDRNPNAFRPKIGKAKDAGPEIIRRHNKGCNCKRSGCLKNYCECYEAKIACSPMCKCVGCRNVEEAVACTRRSPPRRPPPRLLPPQDKQPCSFMTTEVIEAVCQCLVAAAAEPPGGGGGGERAPDPLRDVIHEFARCLQDIIGASTNAAFDEA